VRASRVDEIAAAAPDARTLRLQLLEELRRAVPFSWYAWLLTDPQTGVGCAPLADVPCLPELPTLIRLKYLTTVNRWTHMATPVMCLGERDDRERSRIWRELQSRFGVVDVASLVFRDQHGIWGFLDLWRDATLGAFRPAEVDSLADLVAPATVAIRGSLARTFTPPAEPRSAPGGPVVLLLGRDLSVRAQTPETDRLLRLLVPPDMDRAPVPAGAYNVAAQLLANEAGVDDRPPWARVHLGDSRWLTLSAAVIGGPVTDEHAHAGSDIAVTIENCPPMDRADLFGRVHGLTPREAQVVTRLAAGDDTRTAARALHLSEYTVQDHLKAIFTKTATHDRRSLLAASLGP
jgi:DNA-binding CsgD family transcriptional regulator